ncbi:hypothetical protein LR48_Vigan479s000500 [Vigna angularis]|uniref:NAC domain-containing protein n=1 Tax=Phaseolus angularis TaxID=3914 RepID=A0A0L9TCB8_PHAAN|nr:hypothetical protein LR48_Vigan479s000500 [Vigna angularis]
MAKFTCILFNYLASAAHGFLYTRSHEKFIFKVAKHNWNKRGAHFLKADHGGKEHIFTSNNFFSFQHIHSILKHTHTSRFAQQRRPKASCTVHRPAISKRERCLGKREHHVEQPSLFSKRSSSKKTHCSWCKKSHGWMEQLEGREFPPCNGNGWIPAEMTHGLPHPEALELHYEGSCTIQQEDPTSTTEKLLHLPFVMKRKRRWKLVEEFTVGSPSTWSNNVCVFGEGEAVVELSEGTHGQRGEANAACTCEERELQDTVNNIPATMAAYGMSREEDGSKDGEEGSTVLEQTTQSSRVQSNLHGPASSTALRPALSKEMHMMIG